MQTTIFQIKTITNTEISGDLTITTFHVPTISAYAISSAVVHLGALSIPIPVDWIAADFVKIEAEYKIDDMDCHLTIHYIGIRDYTLLFPSISDRSLQTRLGLFYSELELSFDAGAWLSFMLMTGAVVEGILFSKINKNEKFEKLIEEAHKLRLISDADKNLLHAVRGYRNLVHANRHGDPYVIQKHAMDSRVFVERLIRAG